EAAHKMNLLPKQAEGLLKAYVGMQNEQKQAQEEEKLAKIKEREKDLQTEWGIAYKANLNRAFLAAKEFGGDESVAHLENSGLGNDIEGIKCLNKVGEQLKEDSAPQGGERGGGALS